jgi:inner membrane protein involved in colicin E2 resistance
MQSLIIQLILLLIPILIVKSTIENIVQLAKKHKALLTRTVD